MKRGKTCYLLLFLLTFPLRALIRICACEWTREGQWNQENVFAILSEQGSGSSIGLGFYPRNHQRSDHHPEMLIQNGALGFSGFPTTIQSSGLRYCVHRFNFRLQRNCVVAVQKDKHVFDMRWCLCLRCRVRLSSTPCGSNNLISCRIVSSDTTYPLWIALRCKHRYSCICPLPAISACMNVASSSRLVCFFFFWTDSFWHNLLTTTLPLWAQREIMSLLLKLNYNFTSSSILGLLLRQSYVLFAVDSKGWH